MKPLVGHILFHQPTRVVVEVLEVRADVFRVRPLGSTAAVRWNPGLVEKEARLVAPDGFRVVEYANPDRAQALLADPGLELLRLFARDELARGEDGLKKSVVRTYLRDHLEGPALERAMETLGELLDTSPAFERTGERKDLKYVLRSDDTPADAAVLSRISQLGLPYAAASRDQLIEVVERLLADWRRDRGQPEAVACMGRVASGARDLLTPDAIRKVVDALVPTDDASWGSFRLVNAAAQSAVIEGHREKKDFLRIAALHPSVHPEARVVAMEALIAEEKGVESLLRVSLPGEASPAEQAIALDEAVRISPPTSRAQMGRVAFVRLCRIKSLPDVDLPALVEMSGVAPAGVIIEWVAAALSARARADRVLRRANLIGRRHGLPPDWLNLAVKSLQVGAFLTTAKDALTGPFAALATETPTVLESWLEAGHRRIHGVPEEDPELDLFAGRVLNPEADTDTRARATAVYLERAVAGRRWPHLQQTLKEMASLVARMKAERDEALRLADDLGHARLIVARDQAAVAAQIAASAESEARRKVAEQLAEFERRAASTLSEALSALQTVGGNLAQDEPARNQVLAIEKRLLALARRWSWEPIGRAWEEVEVDPALHDVAGAPEGQPVVATVGIRSVDPYDGRVILKARVVRRTVDTNSKPH